ncbi:MAG: hypothetical protein HOQ09_05815, partial [Gemmatimonadaceae bacterium]|nr:hypothetical protein [Gemmatimonadaceae bacterium]
AAVDVLVAVEGAGRGLSSDEAQRRLAREGPNVLRQPPRTSALARIAAQLRSPVVLLLLFAVALTSVTRQWLDAAAIIAVLLLNAGIGVEIELRARRALESLLALEVPRAVAVRDGRPVELPARELVVGDVIVVDAGRRVPADARLLDTVEMETAEAILTGESAPVAKDPSAGLAPDAPILSMRAAVLAIAYAAAMTAGTLLAFEIALRRAEALGVARSAAFFTLALTQIAQLANAYPPTSDAAPRRSLIRSPLTAAAVLTIGVQLLPLGIPVLARILAVEAPVAAWWWPVLVACALAPVGAGWLLRVARGLRRRRGGPAPR